VLKNALDHLAAPWSGKPVGLVGYGGGAAPGGGNRAVRQLREVVETLGMRPTQAPVVLPRVWAAFGDDGRPSEDAHAVAASTMLDELVQRLSDRRLEAVPVSA
jgi:NAD(P)H-dependent FMN reductase